MIDELLESINDIIVFAKHKTHFEVQVRINDAQRKMRSAVFLANSIKFSSITRDLSNTKSKVKRLKEKTSKLPDEHQRLLNPLIQDAELKINNLRQERKSLS